VKVFAKAFALVPAIVAAACLLGACGGGVAPRVPAGPVEPCRDGHAWQDELRMLDAKAVLNVEPTYWRDACSGAAQVTGTRLFVRRPEPSSERLSHLLHCGGVRVWVGAGDGAQPAGGRLELPEGWVDIDVNREAGEYVVWLSAENVRKNLELLRRATAFAGAKRHGP
jgi:hypothetical protein